MTDQTDEEMIYSRFLELADKRSGYLSMCQPDKANSCYDELYRLLKTRVRSLPDRGLSLLRRVINGTRDVEVSILAAASLLAIDEEYAIRVLRDIELADGEGAFNAKWTIREWRDGNLTEYWS